MLTLQTVNPYQLFLDLSGVSHSCRGLQPLITTNTTLCVDCLRRRLWLTPNVGGKPETLNCYDFEPTGNNDMRSLVAKVNRKLSRNQFKGLSVTFY